MNFQFPKKAKIKASKKNNCFSSKNPACCYSEKTLISLCSVTEKNHFCFKFTPTKKQTFHVLANNLPVSERLSFTSTLFFIPRYLTKTKTTKLKMKKILLKKKVKIMSMRKKKKSRIYSKI
jgi:hypothetical protein